MKVIWKNWPLLLVFGCILFMFGPMLRADFGVINDHEIVWFLGRDGRITPTKVIPLIRERAIEENGRFRPGYFVLKIFEVYLMSLA